MSKLTGMRAAVAVAVLLTLSLAAGAQQPVDLEIWITGSVSEAGPPPEDWVAYRIVREKLGINLKVVLLPTAFTDQDAKLNTAAAANALPDLFHANRDVWVKLVKAGLVAPVDALYAKMPVRTKTHYSDPIRFKMAVYKGKSYGFADPGKLPQTDGWVIRKDWLDKLGLKVPKTTDELLAVAKAFTEKDPDGNGKADTYGFGAYVETSDITNFGLGVRFDPLTGAFGVVGAWDVSSAKDFGLNVRKPEYYDAMLYLRKIVEAKVIDPDWPTLKKDDFRVRWKQGRFGIMRENFAALSTKANYGDFDRNFPDGQWIPIPPPVGPKGKSSEGMLYADTRIHSVSKRAMDAGKGDAIARLLEWMATDEGYMLLGFGEKGVNYNLDASGNIVTDGIDPAKAYTAKATQPLTQLRNLVFINSDTELYPRYVPHTTSKGRVIKPLEIWRFFASQPWTDATAAQLINPPSNYADFSRYYGENLMKFVLGQQPLDRKGWNDFIEGLDRIGAKELEKNAKAALIESGLLE